MGMANKMGMGTIETLYDIMDGSKGKLCEIVVGQRDKNNKAWTGRE